MLLILFIFNIILLYINAYEAPNIILLMSDDQGWGDVGYNHNKNNIPITPNINLMAKSSNSILFDRFYASSAVCSPTRSSVMTGRSSDRDCIPTAESCGTKPAWLCYEPYPLSPETFTIAEAVKKSNNYNYSTIHLGKWHLGDFWNKHDPNPSWAKRKWPISNPSNHGYDYWMATEASAPSSTTNCGCFEPIEHCIHGHGVYSNNTYGCTNYWFPNITSDIKVSNLTEKIPGDDSEFIMDQFEIFLKNHQNNKQSNDKFLATIWLHTVHIPHPAMPKYYDLYNNEIDGDYLGTIAQMDVQIGRLRQMLRKYNIAEDTLLAFTSDNGPAFRQKSTNGLRACKASLWEGGVRVPGIIEYPRIIKENRRTNIPAYTSDYISTIMDLLNVTFDDNTIVDGTSLMPLIRGEWKKRPSTNPLVFQYNDQVAVIDNELKYIHNAKPGFCDYQPPYTKHNSEGKQFLYNLTSDLSESHDLKNEPSYQDAFQRMKELAENFVTSVKETSQYCHGPIKTIE